MSPILTKCKFQSPRAGHRLPVPATVQTRTAPRNVGAPSGGRRRTILEPEGCPIVTYIPVGSSSAFPMHRHPCGFNGHHNGTHVVGRMPRLKGTHFERQIQLSLTHDLKRFAATRLRSGRPGVCRRQASRPRRPRPRPFRTVPILSEPLAHVRRETRSRPGTTIRFFGPRPANSPATRPADTAATRLWCPRCPNSAGFDNAAGADMRTKNARTNGAEHTIPAASGACPGGTPAPTGGTRA